MALFKRNDNKDQAAEDVAERQSEPKPKRKPKPKRDLRGVVRIEELEQALADQDLDDIDPDAVVSMYMPRRRMERIGAALLRMDKLQKALVVLALAFGVLFALSFMQENMGNFTINLNRLELFRRGVAIADNGDFNNATARLAADAVDNGTNIAAEDLPDNLDDVDGSHNGKNYVAYTFYIRNDSHDRSGLQRQAQGGQRQQGRGEGGARAGVSQRQAHHLRGCRGRRQS